MAKKKPYKHIFFDLDRTLWDFETNSVKAMEAVIEKFSLKNHVSGPQLLFEKYNKYNEYFWELYRRGEVTKQHLREKRFYFTLRDFGIVNKELGIQINDFYIGLCPALPATIPGAKEVVEYLFSKYDLHIISNGFYEIQQMKINSCGLSSYFKHVFTSDKSGYVKPRKEMFMYALNSVNAKKQESIMIGDDYMVDILGAKNFGIDQVYFCPQPMDHRNSPATFTVRKLEEIIDIL